MYKCKKCGHTGNNFWKNYPTNFICPKCNAKGTDITYTDEHKAELLRKANETIARLTHGDKFGGKDDY